MGDISDTKARKAERKRKRREARAAKAKTEEMEVEEEEKAKAGKRVKTLETEPPKKRKTKKKKRQRLTGADADEENGNGEERPSKQRRVVDEADSESEKQKQKQKKKDKKRKKQKKKQPIDSHDEEGEQEPERNGNKLKKEKKKKKKKEDNSINEKPPAFRADISVDPPQALQTYPPFSTFAEVEEVPQWLRKSACGSFTHPTPIQAHTWRPAIAGLDVIGIAKTGSGKTIAFTVPALMRCLKEIKKAPSCSSSSSGAPIALVCAPTRELAMQTANVARVCGEAGKPRLNVACLYGGVSKWEQRKELKNVHVVVATPGRLLDLCEDGSLSLDRVRFFVLDEADRMLDMGFEREMKKIANYVHGGKPKRASQQQQHSYDFHNEDLTKIKRNKEVQTLMYSATWPPEIRAIAAAYLRKGENLIKITVSAGGLASDLNDNNGNKSSGGGPSASHTITQRVEVLDDGRQKDRKLLSLLEELHVIRDGSHQRDRVIVFCLYKKEAARVHNMLQWKGNYETVALHGDMSQRDRTYAFEEFRSGRVPLLVATDVAARGVDIPNVEAVINYTFPLTIEDYVHRIGRTGRAGKTGISHTFFTSDEKALAGALVNVLQQAKQEVPKEIYRFPLFTKKKKKDDLDGKEDLIGKKPTRIVFDDDSDDE